MFPDVLQELKNYFGRDFLLGVFFPVFIFVSASLALYFEIKQGLVSALAGWEKLSLQSQVLLVLGGLVFIMVLSYLIYNFQYNIVRLFEGYWPRNRILDGMRNWRVNLHRKRWQYLNDQNRIAEQFAYYPPEMHFDEFMPTRIGNILRASEIYPNDRYGIDSVILWTRLRPLLPDEVIAPLAESSTARNFMLLMAVFSISFTLIWCSVLAIFTSRWDLFLLCALVGWPLAWICYSNAVQSTLAYSEYSKAVFDLHRFDLLKALNRKIPETLKEEYKEWEALADFYYYHGTPIKPSPPEPDKPTSLDEVLKALAAYLEKVNPPTT